MSDYDAFLEKLNSEAWFREFTTKVLEEGIPEPRVYDGTEESVTRWKSDCYERVGYLSCLSKLGIYVKE